MTYADLAPWADRAGRFSPLRMAAFLGALAPGAYALWAFAGDRLGPEPEKAATHLTGEWTLYLLLATLAIAPLRRVPGWGRLAQLRRMLGLAAFGYVAAHFLLFVLDLDGALLKVATEVASRVYLTIGFVALVGLAALAATSFDRAIRRLGRNWRRLHALVYPLTALGLLHYFMQTKSDVAAPALLAGIFCGLMALRLPALRREPLAWAFLGAAVVAGLAAAGLEALWHAGVTGVPAGLVLAADLDFSSEIRPPWIAAAIVALPALPSLVMRRLRA